MKHWWFLFIIFVFLHFYKLSTQEFVGDEASVMLLIDRAWDSFSLKDFRFLAYPFLFYIEPFRGIFAGTLLHFFGPDKIIVRLPSILFNLGAFWLLVSIFNKENISKTVSFLGLIVYISSAIVLPSRLAFELGRSNFLILLTGYLIYSGSLSLSLWSFLASFLTVTNAAIFIPSYLWLSKKVKRLSSLKWILLIIALYLILWTALPYFTYRFGFQAHYINRGLFYFLSRAKEGISLDPLKSLRALAYYSSWLLTALVFGSFVFSWFVKKLRPFQIVAAPTWLALLFLSRPSFHILVHIGLLFLQLIFVLNWFWQKYLKSHSVIIFLLTLTIALNLYGFYSNFLTDNLSPTQEFRIGRLDVPQLNDASDEAVKRIYQSF